MDVIELKKNMKRKERKEKKNDMGFSESAELRG
jgi:hypothetical protein